MDKDIRIDMYSYITHRLHAVQHARCFEIEYVKNIDPLFSFISEQAEIPSEVASILESAKHLLIIKLQGRQSLSKIRLAYQKKGIQCDF